MEERDLIQNLILDAESIFEMVSGSSLKGWEDVIYASFSETISSSDSEKEEEKKEPVNKKRLRPDYGLIFSAFIAAVFGFAMILLFKPLTEPIRLILAGLMFSGFTAAAILSKSEDDEENEIDKEVER